MIIGISGKIGSGKDTVGKIVQYLTSKKDNKLKIETYLESQNTFINDGFEIKRFADKLKDIVCMLIGCTREQLEDREFKEKELSEEWWYWSVYEGIEYKPSYFATKEEAKRRYSEVWEEGFENYVKLIKLTPRLLLQLLGTECGRNIIHPNIWVNALMIGYKQIIGYASGDYFCICGNCKKQFIGDKRAVRCKECSIFYSNWIITDVRFPNEARAIKARDGILIRIERDYVLRGGPEDPKNQHPSETALDGYQDWDYIIQNDGTIKDLVEKVENVMKNVQFSNKLLIT